ncbi:glycosyltransferase family 39 protein [Bradyrhizobium centrosematis]|uniref:glycosyltransferase family 39 protein n=1 Tax=Bradyrhizobium centrosematis TaxID=1300039 RepID=UPI00216A09D8|nr:glycosyltransferase family 39 protein [Bradyrhizobium centrosematis]MCS3761729.1 4-amino-4-deoxy-L-arabinose transferase-like glycosyltransferase [Bradyrhizobium centrosematis]MCS3774397.1 4-amino-4-deoxy-L-arabinose transferase-like glycosyltransferase [Bradyrhizobium centrosematis]
MSTTSISSARPRAKTRLSFDRFRAWLVACAIRPEARLWLVIQLAILHAVLWTFILINLKAAQDVHMDVAEAWGWGQKFLWGYGKHPPLSGWVAGLWFTAFPATDWATYALAMATVGLGMVICWLVALRVVDARRAFLAVVMVALYPIFNFKGFKYNPDLLQLVTLPLLVLAYLNAFEKRSWQSGLWLGLAGALALMTKYWVLTMIGAIGLAALIHPERLKFLASPAPWVAIVTMGLAMIPHIVWLAEAHFVPLTYAGDTYSLHDDRLLHQLVAGYALHNVALLALPVALAALAMAWVPPWFKPLLRAPSRIVTRAWARGANPGVNLSQALNVWIVQVIVAVGPPLGALAFSIYMKTDWGISLFFLVPLALVAIPALRVQSAVLFNITAIWLVLSVATLAASPWIAAREMAANAGNAQIYGARSELARELTQAWHSRFASRWAVVAGTMEQIQPLVFYSPDHPSALLPLEAWDSGLTSRDDAKKYGFIGVFDPTDGRLPAFEKWVSETAPNAERIVMTTRRFTHGKAGPSMSWNIYIAPPGK